MREEQIISRNGLAYTVRDSSPVTPLHTLILPNRHIAGYFDLTRRRSSQSANCWKKPGATS
jgi:diadenosine tetraphosphate (Ap4A) HIT family hydrolase